MSHLRPHLPLLAVAVALLAAAPALAATRGQAQTKARQAADHYTNGRYGIGGGWRQWSASCNRRGAGGWTCHVSMNGGQCSGTLKLTTALRPFAHRIGCGE